MTRRLLLVEASATMRHVLEKHVRALGHEVEATDSYEAARKALESQYSAFSAEISGVLFGWPSLSQDDADAFTAYLERADLADLPVIVMSTDMGAASRAWVAGRPHTAMLAWKDYLGIDASLERLLDDGSDSAEVPVSRFDNGDIHVLVVDDSRTIRYALRDLFEQQGYRVSLAATRDEALTAARATRFDIAILDFYLEESTGDVLCRELVSDPNCGDVVCAILTGTYADHIIKRSLRAGAVECMFKNESSELLLSRIDAIGRFVRQRRSLEVGRELLERTIDAIADAVLVLDPEGRVSYASAAALVALGLPSDTKPSGVTIESLCAIEELPVTGEAAVRMTWRSATRGPIDVSVTRTPLVGSEASLLSFERADASTKVPASPTRAGPLVPRESAQSSIDALQLATGSVGFVGCLIDYLESPPMVPDNVSLLILGVHENTSDGHRRLDPESHSFPLVDQGLQRLYRRESHVAALGGHRFGLLVRHTDEPQSYLLTRRLMQMCNELLVPLDGNRLATTACLIALSRRRGVTAEYLLRTGLRGLDIVEVRGVDQALLLDLKRMLTVYPVKPVPAAEMPAKRATTGSGKVVS